jgi:hypothetical protein
MTVGTLLFVGLALTWASHPRAEDADAHGTVEP